MDHVVSPFDQLKALVTGPFSPQPGPTIDFTPEQGQALHGAKTPVPALDPATKKEYVIVQ
jgi:hypothetical protein